MGGRFVLLRLALRSLWSRRGLVVMTALAIAVSVGLLLTVEKLRGSARASFFAAISNTDIIVGARSGEVQLLLYSVFRMGAPTRNMSWESYQDVAAHPNVKWIVPISLGDSHRGFRVLGTTNAYYEHYRYRLGARLKFAAGGRPEDLFDAVIGADVAQKLGYAVGDKIIVAHGIWRDRSGAT